MVVSLTYTPHYHSQVYEYAIIYYIQSNNRHFVCFPIHGCDVVMWGTCSHECCILLTNEIIKPRNCRQLKLKDSYETYVGSEN